MIVTQMRRDPMDQRKVTAFYNPARDKVRIEVSDWAEGREFSVIGEYTQNDMDMRSHREIVLKLSARLDKAIRNHQEELWLNLTP